MRLSQKTLASFIDDLGRKRARFHELEAECDMIADAIKKTIKKSGYGEGDEFIAEIVKMPKKVMVVKAHAQLRTRAK